MDAVLSPSQAPAAVSPELDKPCEPPAKPCEALDPRIRRTRELLQDSLGKLIATKDFDKISVHEITDAAGLNRATFYAHYNDKFALLECLVAGRFMALLDERGIIVAGGCTNALRGLVVGLCDFMAHSTCVIHDPGANRTLQPHMETALLTVLRRMILDGMAEHEPETAAAEQTIRAAAIAWAIYGATRESLAPADHPSADQIAASVITLVGPLFLPAA